MKILAKVEYFGKNYHGWQKQDNAKSVQEEIEKVLSKLLNSNITIFGSGRTDSGVHAKGQTFHFEINKEIDLEKLLYSTNILLADDIHVLSFVKVSEDFHARFSAKGKHYAYRINVGKKNPFETDYSLFYPYQFDQELFLKALKKFIGKHNFQNFTSKETDEENFIRSIDNIALRKENDILTVDLFGNGFMRYMIRYIIGTALTIASGKEDISYIEKNLNSTKRNITSYKVDSVGLYLIEVFY